MKILISRVIETLSSQDDTIRHRTFEELIDPILNTGDVVMLFELLEALDVFRKSRRDPYERVRAALFLSELYGLKLMNRDLMPKTATLSPALLAKIGAATDEDEMIDHLLHQMIPKNMTEFSSSGLSECYRRYAFQTLRHLVEKAIESSPGNEMLFSIHSLSSYQLTADTFLTKPNYETGLYPIIRDTVAVRMDPSHSGWSDIFFLGMDFPEGARVVNISIDLSNADRTDTPQPPVETYIRMIDEPFLRLSSIDMGTTKDIVDMGDLFTIHGDRLALLKAGIIASGLVPPSLRTTSVDLTDLLRSLLGRDGGIELCTFVRDIPAGSRLAVSTSLLASIIISCMRFSGQLGLETRLSEDNRRLVASRAILGEWVGGSGGGWQDSGGIWPGLKIITGRKSMPGDHEFGKSRGVLLPDHRLIPLDDEQEEKLTSSIILFHGGLAANIGPILEMVTERYLLRLRREWRARLDGYSIFDNIVTSLLQGNMHELGLLTSRNFEMCIRPIIPWVDNDFTARLRRGMKERFKDDLWGFLMLGGMTGGGMAFIVNPARRGEIEAFLRRLLQNLHEEMQDSLFFAMKPTIFRFAVNHQGDQPRILSGEHAILPTHYYRGQYHDMATGERTISERFKKELHFAGVFEGDQLFLKDHAHGAVRQTENGEDHFLDVFDSEDQERIRAAVLEGELSCGRNRLPGSTQISDARPDDVVSLPHEFEDRTRFSRLITIGRDLLNTGALAVVTMAAGAGSRWTGGTSVVKATSPFCEINGRHCSFLEIHLAKTNMVNQGGARVAHVFTTSVLTDKAVRMHLPELLVRYRSVLTYVSTGTTVLRRMVPPPWNLIAGGNRIDGWEQQWLRLLEHNENARILQRQWNEGKAGDKIEHCPIEQLYYPPGHFHELPSLIKNGTLAGLLADFPNLRYLLLHNLDTCGVRPDPLILGFHANSTAMLTFEVTARRWSDRGGGLARVDGKTRLVEGLALPDPAWEKRLSWYNTLTTLVTIDDLLGFIGITRDDIVAASSNREYAMKVSSAVNALTRKMPKYITIKTLKYRSQATGYDVVCPVLQCERLWGDVTALDDVTTNYVAVHRFRGHQLKDPASLDMWARDGSAAYVSKLMSMENQTGL